MSVYRYLVPGKCREDFAGRTFQIKVATNKSHFKYVETRNPEKVQLRDESVPN